MHLPQIRLLGRFDIQHQGRPIATATPQKSRELLAYLLLHRARPHHREQLATLLWQEADAAQAKAYLRKALWQLQSELPACSQLLEVEPEWVQCHNTGNAWLDVVQFESSYLSTLDERGGQLDAGQCRALQEATELYRGELLTSWAQDWCLLERERFARMHLIMLDKLVMYCLAAGHYEQGIQYAVRLLGWDEARERTHRHLMRLYALSDDRTAAIRQFHRCVQVLQEELGVDPSPQTVALYQAVCANLPLGGA